MVMKNSPTGRDWGEVLFVGAIPPGGPFVAVLTASQMRDVDLVRELHAMGYDVIESIPLP